MERIPIHPAAELLPMMPDAELELLAESIRTDGQREPIEILDGHVIDGRNRLIACKVAGVEPVTRDIVDVSDPIAYVLAKNVSRRHLTTSQRAMVAARARMLYAKAGDEIPQPEIGKSLDKAAETVNVGSRSVDFAAAVVESGSESLQEMVSRGEISVSAAATVAKNRTRDEQTALAAAGREAVRRAAADIRLAGKQPSTAAAPASPAAPMIDLFADTPQPQPAAAPARQDAPAAAEPPRRLSLIEQMQQYEGRPPENRMRAVEVNTADPAAAARQLIDALGLEFVRQVARQVATIGGGHERSH